jgi:hypothetical protein
MNEDADEIGFPLAVRQTQSAVGLALNILQHFGQAVNETNKEENNERGKTEQQ